MFSRRNLRAPLILLIATVFFHWRILFTNEFSLLTGYENVNQAYSWYTFWIGAMKHGFYPLWDPYTFAGHPFAGEMQTGAFYPLNFLLALFPFNRDGLFSQAVYNAAYALTRFAGAYFLYLLARELEIAEFPAIIAGLCFTLGGALSHFEGWPHLLQSGIWLPLIFLFLLRALRSDTNSNAVRNALVSGLCLGLSILAGGLHLVMMQAIVVVSAAAFHAFAADRAGRVRAAIIVAVVACTAFAAGAVQLFPSFEYSQVAYRFLGGSMLPATQKIPYAYLSDKMFSTAPLQLLLPMGFGGNFGTREVTNAYIGVFPLLLAGIGLWRYWRNRWVRYFAFLALGGYLYSLADLSLLHGLLYAIVPDLWMAREAPRFLYLTDFALVLLAGFGAQALFNVKREDLPLAKLTRGLNWVVAGCGIALAVPALFGKPEVNPWISFSLLLIVLTWALYRFIVSGHRGPAVQALALALVLFDLYGWDWGPKDRILQASSPAGDEMEKLHSLSGAVAFLRSRPGPFRVQIEGNIHPNIGDTYGIEAMNGGAATLLQNVSRILARGDLLNVRYALRPASAPEPGPVYQDVFWKVYENRSALPRAWLVHRVQQAGSPDDVQKRLNAPGFNPQVTALVGNPASLAVAPAPPNSAETAQVRETAPGRLDIRAHAAAPAMLILSEIFYPGWTATVNGRPAPIVQADGALRGMIVHAGNSNIVLRYQPVSVYCGAALTILAFAAVLGFELNRRRSMKGPQQQSAIAAADE